MANNAQEHNDSLMKTGLQILKKCKEESLPCMLWGGGAIYFLLGGRLDYRKMSDLEFFLPTEADKQIRQILTDMGFYANKPFNSLQNMYKTRRREFYRPNRELTSHEIEEVEHGRKGNIDDVEFQKVELFVYGIKMCWNFKFDELPDSYKGTLICPSGFQLALKANAIHPDDFDLKDIQDISSVLSSNCCGALATTDTIFKEAVLDENIQYSIGKEIFEHFSKTKYDFPSTLIRNFTEVLNYSGLSEGGKSTLLELIEFLKPCEEKNKSGGFLSKARKEKPVRVDAR
ncbi:MAG: nucleotidyltransferase family protein [Candidatus Hodarchaeales archaeon]|jgi:hypothetical protein